MILVISRHSLKFRRQLRLVFLAPLLRSLLLVLEKLLLYSVSLGLSQRVSAKVSTQAKVHSSTLAIELKEATFSYNTSSVVEGFGTEQYGLITDNATTTDDLGSVGSAYLPPSIDHGDLVILPGEENPFGLFKIAGGDTGHKQTFAGDFGGSLFGASGAAEAAVWQTPEETFLFRTSGGAIEKHVESYVGTGNIKIKEETPLAPNSHIRFRPHWRTQHLLGTPRILGNADAALKGAYVSEGVFSRMYTHDKGNEWRRYRPSPRYVNSIYGKIGGSAFVNGDGGTRKINVYGYYGDDRDPGTSGSLFGIGGGAEVQRLLHLQQKIQLSSPSMVLLLPNSIHIGEVVQTDHQDCLVLQISFSDSTSSRILKLLSSPSMEMQFLFAPLSIRVVENSSVLDLLLRLSDSIQKLRLEHSSLAANLSSVSESSCSSLVICSDSVVLLNPEQLKFHNLLFCLFLLVLQTQIAHAHLRAQDLRP